MYTHTKFEHEYSGSPPPHTAYVVCSTPRCGSSLLCEALCNTGLAGAPTEYFDEMTREGFCRAWQVDSPENYLKALLNKKTSTNGVFGFKAHYHQFKESFGVEELPIFCPRLKFIWISREDIVCQAVSYWKAIQTNQWAVTHVSTNDLPTFDFDRIQELEQQIEFEEQHWQAFFKRHSITPLRLKYEEFSTKPIEAAHECLKFLGVQDPPNLDPVPLTLEKQADELSERWVRQYRQIKNQV